jgi:aerobic carbon-monoxide dehydrogenase large subunit
MTRPDKYVGKGIPMVTAGRFTRGMGRYVNDLPLASVSHVAFARSTEAHARITNLDIRAAAEHPDAIAVYTAEDLFPLLVNPYWGGWEGTARAEGSPLARDKVRWVGEPVAAVLASSRYVAEDIAELVEVSYDPLPAVTDPERALEEGSALLYDEWGNNTYFHDELEAGDLAGAFERAAGVVHRRFTAARHTGTPLETRGIIAEFDPGLEQLTIQANFQDVYLARAIIAGVLDMPPAQVRVASPDSGGGFGVKLPVYPEEVACSCIALLTKGPVKWIQDRQEDLLGTSQHRDLIIDAEVPYAADGRMLGLRVRIVSDGGAYGVPARGNTVEGMMAAEDLVAGGHDIQDYAYTLDVAMTNKPPTCVYRGVAQPVTVFALDSIMDDIAARTGVDRGETRRRNLIKRDQFPYETATKGYVMEAGSYVEALDKALELIGFDDFPAYQQRMREEGRLVGLGLSCGAEAAARGATWYGKRGLPISGQEGCQIKIDHTGRVYAQLGTTTQGQGLETSLGQLIADELGVQIDDVRVTMGDTDRTPYGAGTWASRCATLGGSAALRASEELREKLLRVAAARLEANPDDLELADGHVSVKGAPSTALTMREVARIAYFEASDLPRDIEPTLEAVHHFDPPSATFSNSTHAIILEVDPGTGAISFHRWVCVHDCGTVLNPLIVNGQLQGAMAQGLGGTILEHSVYDDRGQPLATTFMDYLVPTSLDVPDMEMHHFETPSPFTGLGVKGVGESGTVFAPGAIATGVADALGTNVDRLELSPSAVYDLLKRRDNVPAAA